MPVRVRRLEPMIFAAPKSTTRTSAVAEHRPSAAKLGWVRYRAPDQEHVVRLEIAVHYARRVRGPERSGDLLDDADRARRQGSVRPP